MMGYRRHAESKKQRNETEDKAKKTTKNCYNFLKLGQNSRTLVILTKPWQQVRPIGFANLVFGARNGV